MIRKAFNIWTQFVCMKKIIGGFIILLILLSLGLVYFLPLMKLNQELSEYDLSSCSGNKVNLESGYACYTSLAVKYHEPLICEKLKESRRNLCYQKISWEYNDTEVCDLMGDVLQPSDNKDGGMYSRAACYFYIAERKRDVGLCLDDNCKKKIAIMNQDLSICDTIIYHGDRAGCFRGIAKVSENYSICDRMKDIELVDARSLADCYWKSAGTNIAACVKIGNMSDLDEPSIEPQCYRDVATASGEESMCEKILDFPEYSSVYVECLNFFKRMRGELS